MVTLGSKNALAKDVLLVENMNHNMLSVGQMCDHYTRCYLTLRNVKSGKESSVKLWLQQVELQMTYIFWMRYLKGDFWRKKMKFGYGTNKWDI